MRSFSYLTFVLPLFYCLSFLTLIFFFVSFHEKYEGFLESLASRPEQKTFEPQHSRQITEQRHKPLAKQKVKSRQGQLAIYILTIEEGQGLQLFWSLWGHTAILVKDRASNREIVFDYGVFRSLGLDFLIGFIENLPVYLLDLDTWERTLAKYRYQRRRIWGQELLGDPKRLEEFYRKLKIHAHSKNRYYVYHMYTYNCTTIVRDLVNEFFDGHFRTSLELLARDDPSFKEQAEQTIFDKGMRVALAEPLAYILLSTIGGHGIHVASSYWEKLYLPSDMLQSLDSYRGFLLKTQGGGLPAEHSPLAGLDRQTSAAFTGVGPLELLSDTPAKRRSSAWLPWLWALLCMALYMGLFYIVPLLWHKKRWSAWLAGFAWCSYYIPAACYGTLLTYIYLAHPTHSLGRQTIGYHFSLFAFHPLLWLMPFVRIFLQHIEESIHSFFLFLTALGMVLAFFLAPYQALALFFAMCLQGLILLRIRKRGRHKDKY